MSSQKAYDRNSKRVALGLWIAISATMLGALVLPLYWFWDRIASRPSILLLILGLLAWTLFNGGKLMFSTAKRIRKLPEN